MLRLHSAIEDWREQVVGWIDDDVNDADELADELARNVLARLVDSGIEYERAYQQRRGAFVLVQSGTEEEIATFDKLLDEEIAAMRERVSQAHDSEGLEMRSYTLNGAGCWEWNGDGWPVGEDMSRDGDFSAYAEGEPIRLAVFADDNEQVAVYFGTVKDGKFDLNE
jgi:hypothetical protein